MSFTQESSSSKYGSNDNPINSFYQPYYAKFHGCKLFNLMRNSPDLINAEVVNEANEVLREMYSQEKPELRNARFLIQKDNILYHNFHPIMYDLIRNSGKFHKVFFVKQPELFALIMGLDTRTVKVNCYSFDESDRQGQFELEFQGNKSDTVEYHRSKNSEDSEGFTKVRRANREFKKPEFKKYNKPHYVNRTKSETQSTVLDSVVSSIKSVKVSQDTTSSEVKERSTVPFDSLVDTTRGSSWATMVEEDQGSS
jgi:hypothetical protein